MTPEIIRRRRLPERRRRAIKACGLLFAALAASGPAAGGGTAPLQITVTGLRSNAGNVHIALYDDPARFPDSDGMILKIEAPISGRVARHEFPALSKKRYAIAVYHDANDNDSFDQGFLGIPLEDFAFSNGAAAFLGPPSFEAAAFTLNGALDIRIRIGE